MKKIVLTMTAMGLLLCGCTSSSAAAKTVDLTAVKEGIASIEDVPALMELSEDDISSYLGIESSEYTAAVCEIPMMNVHATEVVLFQYETDSQKANIQSALDTRLKQLENTWSQYLPDQYDLVKNRTEIDANHVVGYIIGEEAFVSSVTKLIDDNTK